MVQFPPCVRYDILTLPKSAGELGPLHVEYYLAAHMARLLDCEHNFTSKQWVLLDSLISDLSPLSLPWVTPDKRPLLYTLPFCVPFFLIPMIKRLELKVFVKKC